MSSSEAAPATEQQQQQKVAAETMLPAGTATSEVPAKSSDVKQVQPAGSKGGSGAAASKDTQQQQQPTAATSIVETVKRFIPGLGAGSAAAAAPEASKPKRSRGAKKGKQDVNLKTSNDAAHDAATLESAPSRDQVPDSLQANLASTNNVKGSKPTSLSLLNGGSSSTPGGAEDGSLTASEQALLDSKRSFSPSSIVQKRLKANNKKLQRISGYENQVEALNADQKKAVAGKPALEAVQRELGELSKVFEEEEKEEDKNGEKRKQIEQRLARYRTEQAVKKANLNTQNDLTLLLQFLHLYSCFNPTSSGIAPPILPPVVANATAQQHAAVHTLFHTLANGPLFGGASATSAGEGDAVSQIKALQDGSKEEILEGVSFADLKQMILDLTAPPAEIGHELPESEVPASLSGDRNGTLDGAAAPPAAGGLSFLQASEINGQSHGETVTAAPPVLSPPTAADDAEHEKALETTPAATPGFGSAIPAPQKKTSTGSGVGTPAVFEPEAAHPAQELGSAPAQQAQTGWDAPTLAVPAADGWGDNAGPAKIESWADDVDDANPSDPFTATPDVPSELANAPPAANVNAAPAVVDDGFRAVGGEGRSRGGGRGRGSYNNSNGGQRGGFRGGERGSFRGSRGGRSNSGAIASAASAAISAAEGAGEVVPGAPGTIEGERRSGFRGGRGGRGGGEYRGSGAPGGGGRGRGEGRGGRGRGGEYRGGRGGAASVGAPVPAAPTAAV